MRRSAFVLALLIVLAGSGAPAVAQSVSLLQNGNGTVARLTGSAGFDGVYGGALGTSYTIGGVLDVGLTFGLELDQNARAIQSDIGIAYAVAPIRQSAGLPFSVQVYGSYTYRGEQSDFLAENRLLREARGYTVGVSVVRDFLNENGAGARLGALLEYADYLEVTTVGFNAEGFTGTAAVDYADYPQEERRADFSYGAYVGGVLSVGEKGSMTMGVRVQANEVLRITVRPDLQILFVR